VKILVLIVFPIFSNSALELLYNKILLGLSQCSHYKFLLVAWGYLKALNFSFNLWLSYWVDHNFSLHRCLPSRIACAAFAGACLWYLTESLGRSTSQSTQYPSFGPALRLLSLVDNLLFLGHPFQTLHCFIWVSARFPILTLL